MAFDLGRPVGCSPDSSVSWRCTLAGRENTGGRGGAGGAGSGARCTGCTTPTRDNRGSSALLRARLIACSITGGASGVSGLAGAARLRGGAVRASASGDR